MNKLVCKISFLTLLILPFNANSMSLDKMDVANNKSHKNLKTFVEVYNIVKNNYVKEVDDKVLIESALAGMLSGLDPHSNYLNTKETEDLEASLNGKFGGIGVIMTEEDEKLFKIIACIEDSPAEKSGIKNGDTILNINDESVIDLTFNNLAEKMRGEPGTKVKIGIAREGEKAPLEFNLKREIIKIPNIKSNMFGDIGYVRIRAFNKSTTDDFKQAIESFKKETNNKVAGYIIDLRNNAGGLLEQAYAMANCFLDKGVIFSTKGRNSTSNKIYEATSGKIIDTSKPIIVLINEGTASCPEIVAGALKDHKIAIIMGVKSFGKGSVQEVITIPETDGEIKLTTALHYTPSGKSIQAEGITPDIIVEQSKIELLKSNFPSEAKLKHHLHADNKKEEVKKTDIKSSKEKDLDKLELYKKDFQLARALDLIRSLSLFGKK